MSLNIGKNATNLEEKISANQKQELLMAAIVLVNNTITS